MNSKKLFKKTINHQDAGKVVIDLPIMQWVPLIKKIQAANKSVVVDLSPTELEPFMKEVDPEGILLCINADLSIQKEIIKKVEKWTKH